MRSQPIYLDHAATTPVDPRVLEKMLPWLQGQFGNPASNTHPYGWEAEEAVEQARAEVASLVNAMPREIVWTSGATESNNLALKGAAHQYASKGKHIITLKTEHRAVLDTCEELERQGFEVTYLDVQENGLLDIELFKEALQADTILVSVMLVNSETGVIQDIESIGELCKERGIVFHVDAAQAAGKVPIDLQTLPVDVMSFSAHKVYGPKGIGALYVRSKPRIRLQAQIHGGGHERGFRSGTLATHQIVGMGEAFRLAQLEMEADSQRISRLRDRLWAGLAPLKGMHLNGDYHQRIVHNLNLSFDYIEGEALMLALSGLAVSSGSACNSATLEPSYVLCSMGRSAQLAHSSIRIVLGRFTTEQEIDSAIQIINKKVQQLQEISPLFDIAEKGVSGNDEIE